MPTRKAPPTPSKPAPAGKPSASRALTVWEQKMADAAAQSAKAEKPVSGLSGISIKGGILSVDDSPVPGNEMNVVVLVAMHANEWHNVPYNPDVPQIPACYAFGEVDAKDQEETMHAHEKAEDPQGADEESRLCDGCWANEMGSADIGRGKACKNVRRLAVIGADDAADAETIKDAEVRTLKVPVMSVKGWALYVKSLPEEANRPYWCVVTNVKVVPDAKSQFRVVFAFGELLELDEAIYDALETKRKAVIPQISAPYQKIEAAPPPPARGGRGAPARPAPAPVPVRGPVSRKAAPAPAPVAKGKPAAAPVRGKSKF